MVRVALLATLLVVAVASVASQTDEPTPPPLPPSCPVPPKKIDALYRTTDGCKPCRVANSPFRQNYNGITCVPPTTLSAQSTVCTNAVHPAYILTTIPPYNNTLVSCISTASQTVRIVMPVRNSNYPFVTSKSFIGASLSLDGRPRNVGPGQAGEGTVGFYGNPPIRRIYFSFTFPSTQDLVNQAGQTIQLTGAWRRRSASGPLLNVCFVAYLTVCG